MDIETARVIVRLGPLNENEMPIYGGILIGGGFDCITEYEVGAQRFTEAVHCVLGSIDRAAMRPEDAHIREEMGIVHKCVKEYGRKLYVDRVTDNRDDFGERSVASIRRVAPKLQARAEGFLRECLNWFPHEPKRTLVVVHCYKTLIAFAKAMIESVEEYPKRMKNAFNSWRVEDAVTLLQTYVDAFLKVYKGPKPLDKAWLIEGNERIYSGTIRKMTGYKRGRPHPVYPQNLEGYVSEWKEIDDRGWDKPGTYAVTLDASDGSIVWFKVAPGRSGGWWNGNKPTVRIGDSITVRGDVATEKPSSGRGGTFVVLRSADLQNARAGQAGQSGHVDAELKAYADKTKRALRPAMKDWSHVENNYAGQFNFAHGNLPMILGRTEAEKEALWRKDRLKYAAKIIAWHAARELLLSRGVHGPEYPDKLLALAIEVEKAGVATPEWLR